MNDEQEARLEINRELRNYLLTHSHFSKPIEVEETVEVAGAEGRGTRIRGKEMGKMEKAGHTYHDRKVLLAIMIGDLDMERGAIRQVAEDWIGSSQGLMPGEIIDREALAEQLPLFPSWAKEEVASTIEEILGADSSYWDE